jgi:hypothetical protein
VGNNGVYLTIQTRRKPVMSMMDEVGERGLGWPLGLGLVVAAVSMGPQIAKGSRPLIKRAIKGYLAMQSRTKEMMAETGERLQDLYAEAKHEYEEEGVTTMAAAEEGGCGRRRR